MVITQSATVGQVFLLDQQSERKGGILRQPRMVVVQIVILQSLLVGQFNLQHHYDFGRGIFTSTAEFFFVDNHGSTFGFADINHDSHHYDKKGATDVYFEVARYFALPWMNKNLSFTLQYNDGAIFFPLTAISLLSAVQRSWLGGVSYTLPLERLILSTDALIRHEQDDGNLTYQWTVVWFYPFSDRISSMGHMDIWNSNRDGTVIMMTEPQLLYSTGKMAVGVEVEITRNFPGAWNRSQEYFDGNGEPAEGKFWFLPTVFVKYTF